MKRDKDIDWVKALAELNAKKKPKPLMPAWAWGLVTLTLLLGLMCVGRMAPKSPRKAEEPALQESAGHARIGQTVTFSEDCWGYASPDLLTQACRAAGKHAETYAQFNRDTFAQGKACPMSQGEDCEVVDKATHWGDVYLRVRREGSNRAWWVLATEVE